jgi:TRAP-type C4-dicarboxylate transport system permease small subunit
MYRKFTAAYAKLLSWVLVASVAILIIPVSMQIFSRTIPLIPAYIWTEEMARFLFVWSIMIGAIAGLFIMVFALVFVWWGWEFTWNARNRISELAELPLWMIHLAWPLAGFTWVVFQAEHLYDNARVVIGGKS